VRESSPLVAAGEVLKFESSKVLKLGTPRQGEADPKQERQSYESGYD
jgi:hypothetical protein